MPLVILQQHVSEADWLRLEREHFRPACSVRDVLQVVPWAMAGLPADGRRKARAAGRAPIFVSVPVEPTLLRPSGCRGLG